MASEENSICENGKLTGKLIFLWHFWNTSNYCLIDSSCRRLSGHYLVHPQFISVFNYFASVSRILIFLLYSHCYVSIAHSLFSSVLNCRVISCVPTFLRFFVVTLASRVYLSFSSVQLLPLYLTNVTTINDTMKTVLYFRHVTSVFSPVIDYKVSISRILCFPMWSIVTLVSRVFFLFSPVMDC